MSVVQMRQSESESRRSRRKEFVLVALLGLAGCDGDGSDQQKTNGVRVMGDVRIPVAENAFDQPGCMHWHTYGSIGGIADIKPLELAHEPDGNGYAISSAPWWVDPNHGPPGAGFLNLIAIAYYDGWSGIDAEVRAPSEGRPLDLRNMAIRLRWRAPTLSIAPESKLVFWFQTRAIDPTHGNATYVNYAFTGSPLQAMPGNPAWQETEIRLRSRPELWTCLGSSLARADTYGCARNIDEALSNFEADLGFVILSPDEGSALSSTGAVEFDSITMLLPPANLRTHRDTVPYLDTVPTLCVPES